VLGGFTVTVNVQVLVSPHESLTVAVTNVVPIGNVLPLGGFTVTVFGLHPPLEVTINDTAAPLGPVAVTVILEGQ